MAAGPCFAFCPHLLHPLPPPKALITTAVSADLGTHESLSGNAKVRGAPPPQGQGASPVGPIPPPVCPAKPQLE
jgi:hypothetical protein